MHDLDEEGLVSLVRGVSDICNDFAQLPLWRLASKSELSASAIAEVSRFLGSPNLNNVSAAVECLKRAPRETAIQLLSQLLHHPLVFVRYRAAATLNSHGDHSGLDMLVGEIQSHSLSTDELRDLLWRLLPVAPERLYPVYIRLLSDKSVWVRYHAIKRLELYAQERFGFDYRYETLNADAIADLTDWFDAKHSAGDLPKPHQAGDPFSGRGAIGFRLDMSGLRPRVVKVFPWSHIVDAEELVGAELMEVNGFPTDGKTGIELKSYEFEMKPGDQRLVVFRTSRGRLTLDLKAVAIRIGSDDFLQTSGVDI